MQGQPGDPEYGGPAPLSSPETRIIKLTAETAAPHAFVALQSGSCGVRTPQREQGEGPMGADVRELLDKLNTYCACDNRGNTSRCASEL